VLAIEGAANPLGEGRRNLFLPGVRPERCAGGLERGEPVPAACAVPEGHLRAGTSARVEALVEQLLELRVEEAVGRRGRARDVPRFGKPRSRAYSSSAAKSCWRPRNRRERTVPTGHASTTAASSYARSSRSTSTTAARNASGSWRRAVSISAPVPQAPRSSRAAST